MKNDSTLPLVRAARVYLRVSTDEQDLSRQEAIVAGARAAGYYVAAVYREKASGARSDRPELLRMVADLQSGEVVVAEKIDRLRPVALLKRAERLVILPQQNVFRIARAKLSVALLRPRLIGPAGLAKLVLIDRQRVVARQQALLEIGIEAVRQLHEVRVRIMDHSAFDIRHRALSQGFLRFP